MEQQSKQVNDRVKSRKALYLLQIYQQ